MATILTPADIRRILRNTKNEMPSDDFRLIDSWAEYKDGPSYNERPLDYLCYEIEVINPETGEKSHLYKAIKLLRIIRLPYDAKQSTSLMDKHEQVLAAVYEKQVNLVTVIANIIEPVALGLLFLYGVQGVAPDLEAAKQKAHSDYVGLKAILQGTYRVMHMRDIQSQEAEWLREKMFSMDYLTMVRGIPKASKSGEDAGNKGLGNKNLNPDSMGTMEELIAGMVDYEYVIQVISTPVFLETLKAWQTRTQLDMTLWNSQLQGTKSISASLSLPMMYMANTGSSQGWSHAYTNADTVSSSTGESFNFGVGESIGKSLSQTFGQSFGQSQGVSVSDSISTSTSTTIGNTIGKTLGISQGVNESFGTNASVGTSQSVTQSISESLGTSHSIGSNTSRGQSIGTSLGQSISQSVSQSVGRTVSDTISRTVGQTHSISQSASDSISQSIGQSHSVGQSTSTGHTTTNSISGAETWNNTTTTGSSHGTSNTESHSQGGSTTQTEGYTDSYQTSHSDSNSHSKTSGNSITAGVGGSESGSIGVNTGVVNFGGSKSFNWSVSGTHSHSDTTTTGTSDTFGESHSTSNSTATGTNYSDSFGSGTTDTTTRSDSRSTGGSSGWSNSEGYTNSTSNSITDTTSITNGRSASVGVTEGFSVSDSQSASHGVSSSASMGVSQGVTTSASNSLTDSLSRGWSESYGDSHSFGTSTGQTFGSSNSYGTSHSVGNSTTQSASNSASDSFSQSNGITQGRSVGQTQSVSKTESVSTGTSESATKSSNISTGRSTSTGTSKSSGQSIGSTGAITTSAGGSMGLGPSIGYNKSYQWLDQQVKDILELLEYQNERIKKALRGAGAFYTYVYIACSSLDALSAAQTIAKSTWQNPDAMIQPLQVLYLEEEEQKHLLYHFSAFSSDVTRINVNGVQEYKYSTVLLPGEFVAYTHLPRISEGGIFSEVADVPRFAVPSMLSGEIYMGTILSAERYSIEHGYNTPYSYRISEDQLMHGFFTGASRSGKTVAAMRFVAELSRVRRKKTGKRLRIVCMDPKQDWRGLARFVEPERFRFYSMGNPFFHPLYFNPCKIPRGVIPQIWIDAMIGIYCRAYGLLERGKQLMAETFYSLYDEAGVFDAYGKEGWEEKVHELSASVTFTKAYQRMEMYKRQMDDGTSAKGRSGNDTKDAYARLLERLSAFSRPFSIEHRLFGTSDGLGVDDIIGDDDVTVLESKGLEQTFSNFIFGVITSGFYRYAIAQDGGYLAPNQYETVLIIEEANEVLIGSDKAGSGDQTSLPGESEFEQILDQSAGYGLFIFAITQKISDMPSSVIANSGLVFAGRLKREEDINVVTKTIARDPKFDDRNVAKWFPRCPTGWFICQSSRTSSFIDAEPILVKVAMLNLKAPSNTELDEILAEREAKLALKKQSHGDSISASIST